MHRIKLPFTLNLGTTLESGQIFRVAKLERGYRIFSNTIFDVDSDGDYLYYEGVNEEFIKNFFSFDIAFDEIIQSIAIDEHITKAIKSAKGLIILTQDAYETTISFICSAFNNIKRIKLMLENLSKHYGVKNELGYTFPNCSTKFDEEILHQCGFGFRKRYIGNFDKTEDFFKKLYSLDTENAKKELLKIDGIGSKVADCILLFAYRRYEVFCTDVWIKRIIEKLYFNNNQQSVRIIEHFGKEYFGKYAGVAQQYLFVAAKKGVL